MKKKKTWLWEQLDMSSDLKKMACTFWWFYFKLWIPSIRIQVSSSLLVFVSCLSSSLCWLAFHKPSEGTYLFSMVTYSNQIMCWTVKFYTKIPLTLSNPPKMHCTSRTILIHKVIMQGGYGHTHQSCIIDRNISRVFHVARHHCKWKIDLKEKIRHK